jgi:hypothetical protein
MATEIENLLLTIGGLNPTSISQIYLDTAFKS